jgi:hypothetical protein
LDMHSICIVTSRVKSEIFTLQAAKPHVIINITQLTRKLSKLFKIVIKQVYVYLSDLTKIPVAKNATIQACDSGAALNPTELQSPLVEPLTASIICFSNTIMDFI